MKPLRRATRCIQALAIAGLLAGATPVWVSSAAVVEIRTARFVVNLLDYVAADYAGAVADGKILVRSEYEEQKEFARTALETARALPETRDNQDILAGIRGLEVLIAARALPADVARQAQKMKNAVIEAAGIAVAPAEWPNLLAGRALFAQNCAACHGVSGKGDGPAAASILPRPTDFTAAKMRETAPFRAFNVIRVGVPGTAMRPFDGFSDTQVWDLAFYVNALRFGGPDANSGSMSKESPALGLEKVSALRDDELMALLPGNETDRSKALVSLRIRSRELRGDDTLVMALGMLQKAGDDYRGGRGEAARDAALRAYLQGVEPVEPRLRANDPAFTAQLEEKMLAVRAAMEAGKSGADVGATISAARETLEIARTLLARGASSPWVTFLLAAGILLREGFEAVLVLIALLAVVQAAGTRRAALWVHGGWISALALGGVAWIFSGWLMRMSGAQREAMEASVSIFAVVVLLYMGFWLHSRTEIHRWKAFIDGKVRTAVSSGNLMGLATISFMAVFREAFEVVLFLRAVWLDGGEDASTALAAGVFGALGLILVGSWALLRYSARIPVRKVFSICSVLMVILSVVLAGKGMHSLQEGGWISASALGTLHLRWDLLGVFPTGETILAQVATALVSMLLWTLGRRPPARVTVSAIRAPTPNSAGSPVN